MASECHNFIADSIHTKKLRSRLSSSEVQFTPSLLLKLVVGIVTARMSLYRYIVFRDVPTLNCRRVSYEIAIGQVFSVQ